MNERIFPLLERDWFKKEVSLAWESVRLTFAVAQELFSSHTVDAGSILLLRSLAVGTLPVTGTCIDFGCGSGVLGLAFKSVMPSWNVTLIDRDALAVEFSAWNADRLDLDVACRGGLDTGTDGVNPDLVLWNVPGKAGAAVLRALTGRILDWLAPNGLLALVVVHPLANDLEEVIAARSDAAFVHQEAGPEHTVFHVRRESGEPASPDDDAFAGGIFDREQTTVDTGLIAYSFLPVVGLPQYDGPDYATVLLTDAIEGSRAGDIEAVLVVGPGQGHVPIYLHRKWPGSEIVLSDRDLLALRASARAIADHDRFTSWFSAAVVIPPVTGDLDLVTAMLPHQLRSPVMEYWLDSSMDALRAGGHIAVGGGSTEVSRMIALARKRPGLKLRNRDKRKGFSAAIFERV
jgi:16S rRNA (guanine1207-N2)-methyltransferase